MISPLDKALKSFGGFVRYFDTTEPLLTLASLACVGDCRKVLACCGGGDQALTMLGAGSGKGEVWALDINPAQLFVLAAKASFLKRKKIMPSFAEIQKAYPGQVAPVKRNNRHLQKVYLRHTVTGKMIALSSQAARKYALVTGDEMHLLRNSGPYWKDDRVFIARLRARLGLLRFARMDIFDSPGHFKKGTIDLIYLSDIFWPETLAYYQDKLTRMAHLLRPGGRIISYLDQGDDFMGGGISPGRMLAQEARKLALKIDPLPSGYLVLERVKRS